MIRNRVKLIKEFIIQHQYSEDEVKFILSKDIRLIYSPSVNISLILRNNKKFFIEKLLQREEDGQWFAYSSYKVGHYNLDKLRNSVAHHLNDGWHFFE